MAVLGLFSTACSRRGLGDLGGGGVAGSCQCLRGGRAITEILVVRTLGDPAADETFLIGNMFTEALDASRVKYTLIDSPNVTRKAIEDAVVEGRAKTLFFFGHGAAYDLCGHEICRVTGFRKPLVDIVNIDVLVQGGLECVVALACNAARGLGHYCTYVKGTLRSFLGFYGLIIFYLPDMEALGKALTQGMVSMAKDGITAGQAQDTILSALRQLQGEFQAKLKTADSRGDARGRMDALFHIHNLQELINLLYRGGEPHYRIGRV